MKSTVFRKDIVEIFRYSFTGILIYSIVQKIYAPVLFDNFNDFMILLSNLIIGSDFISPIITFNIFILLDLFIAVGLYRKNIFKLASIAEIFFVGRE